MMKYRTLCWIAASLLFHGCTTINQSPSRPTSKTPVHHHANHLTSWQLTGAIAAKQRQKGWSASLTWEQFNSSHYRLSLFGPMGGNAVTIEKNGALVTYQEGQHIEKSKHIETLVYQKTGQKLPLSHLFYWVRGIKSPTGSAIESRDQDGHLITLKQAGYILSYSHYENINGYDLPTKIHIEHQNGWLKLMIKNWVTNA
jgi:outer membrane lipoprotein LolB